MVSKQILFISFKHLNVLIPKLEYHTVVLYNKTQIGWYMSTKYLLLVQWHDDNISSSALRIYIYLTGNWMIFVFESLIWIWLWLENLLEGQKSRNSEAQETISGLQNSWQSTTRWKTSTRLKLHSPLVNYFTSPSGLHKLSWKCQKKCNINCESRNLLPQHSNAE